MSEEATARCLLSVDVECFVLEGNEKDLQFRGVLHVCHALTGRLSRPHRLLTESAAYLQVKEVENDLGTFAFLVHDDSETVTDGRRFVYPLMPNLPVTRVEPLSYILPLDGTTVGEVSVGLVICQVRRLTLSVLVAYFVHGRLRRERTQ